jgi:hypothetical protein
MLGGSRTCATLLCVGAVVLIGAGCGDDGDSTARQTGVTYSRASESPRAFATRMAKLLETATTRKDCRQLDEINGRSLTRLRCPAGRAFRKSMSRFEIVGAKEYGTGAVVDYKSGATPDGAAIVLFVATDRNWAISRFGVLTEPSTGTSDEESRDGFHKAVDDYLTAVRERDCKAFAEVAFTGGASETAVCKAFPSTKALAERMKANPTARPKYEGGNGTYGFFSLETAEPTVINETISVIEAGPDSPSPYVVLDIAPSPTADQQAATIQLLEQAKTQSEPSPSPSKKAD